MFLKGKFLFHPGEKKNTLAHFDKVLKITRKGKARFLKEAEFFVSHLCKRNYVCATSVSKFFFSFHFCYQRQVHQIQQIQTKNAAANVFPQEIIEMRVLL